MLYKQWYYIIYIFIGQAMIRWIITDVFLKYKKKYFLTIYVVWAMILYNIYIIIGRIVVRRIINDVFKNIYIFNPNT